MTTHNQEALKGIGAQEVRLDALEPGQALVLLANSAGQSIDTLSSEASAVAEKCHRIPLALTVVGALFQKSGYSWWQDVLNRLSDVDPQRLRDRLPAYELPDGLLAALQVSIESLPEIAKKAFLDCAVFPENTSIPEAALQKLWSDYLAEGEVAGVAQLLMKSSLLSRDKESYRLHDLYHYFLRMRISAENLPALHRQLVDAYHRDCHYGDWSSGPHDGYFFQHLPYHLLKADKHDNLRTLLLNYNWIAVKLKATGIQAVIADYTDYETMLGDDESIHLVQRALRFSADRLSQDIAQLPRLLFDRLRDMNRRDIVEQLKENCKLKVAVNLASPSNEITCYGHAAGIHAVAVTPNGQWVISACWDRSLKRWNLKESIAERTGISDKTFIGHAGPVRAVTVTPDNKYIISGSDDHTLRVWKLDTGELMYTLGGHEGPIRAVAVTPDGRWVVSGSRDYTVKVWNLSGDRRPTTLDHLHDHTIYAVKVLPDGQRVISASGDCTLKLWNLSTGENLNTLKGHQGRVLTVAVLPDGWRAISGSGSKDKEKSSTDYTLRLWDLDTGTVIRIMEGHTDEVFAVAVLPDGRRAISGACDCTIRLWDLDTGESRILGRHDQGVNAVTVTPDGRYAVSGSNDSTLKIWKLES